MLCEISDSIRLEREKRANQQINSTKFVMKNYHKMISERSQSTSHTNISTVIHLCQFFILSFVCTFEGLNLIRKQRYEVT